MKKFIVEVTEVLQRQIEVETKDEMKAWEEVDRKYHNGEIVLDSEDFVTTEINVLTDEFIDNRDEKNYLNTLKHCCDMLVSTYADIMQNNEDLYLAIFNLANMIDDLEEE